MEENVHRWIEGLNEVLSDHKNEERSRAMAAYMQEKFRFYGIPGELRKQVLRTYASSAPVLTDDQKREVIVNLWRQAEARELHYCAQELAVRWKCYTRAADIELIKTMIIEHSWWDTVDLIASNLLGGYMKLFPEQYAVIQAWNADENMWLVRSTLLYQLKYKDATDLQRLEALIIPHTSNTEFFIKKAIGWALRQASKHHKELVRQLVEWLPLQPLSSKEASKYL